MGLDRIGEMARWAEGDADRVNGSHDDVDRQAIDPGHVVDEALSDRKQGVQRSGSNENANRLWPTIHRLVELHDSLAQLVDEDVTLDQLRAVVHPDATDPDDAVSLTLDNLVTLTGTITDGDGDSASAVLNIGQNLVFEDDGPSISTAAVRAAPGGRATRRARSRRSPGTRSPI